jgi:hypothetical protein
MAIACIHGVNHSITGVVEVVRSRLWVGPVDFTHDIIASNAWSTGRSVPTKGIEHPFLPAPAAPEGPACWKGYTSFERAPPAKQKKKKKKKPSRM